MAQGCGGDVRKSINAVELLCEAAVPKDGTLLLTEADAKALSQRSAMRYDRGGDAMYDAASALHKSIRGSDPDAALHYLGGRDVFSVAFLFEGYENHRIFPGKPSE